MQIDRCLRGEDIALAHWRSKSTLQLGDAVLMNGPVRGFRGKKHICKRCQKTSHLQAVAVYQVQLAVTS